MDGEDDGDRDPQKRLKSHVNEHPRPTSTREQKYYGEEFLPLRFGAC